MALTSGFYTAIRATNGEWDREYTAEQVSELFDGIITDGVYAHVGDKFAVLAGPGMSVNIGTGRSWFKHQWAFNDSVYNIAIPASEVLQPRIDSVILEVDRRRQARQCYFRVLKGTPATTPVAPTLVNDPERGQYALANIRVNRGVTVITQANITNLVGTGRTPFVTSVLQSVSIDTLFLQWTAQWNEYFAAQQKEMEATQAGWEAAWRSFYASLQTRASETFAFWQGQWQERFDAMSAQMDSDWAMYKLRKDVDWTTFMNNKNADWSTFYNQKTAEINNTIAQWTQTVNTESARIDTQLDEWDRLIAQIDSQIDASTAMTLLIRVNEVEDKYDEVDLRLDVMNSDISSLDSRIDKLESGSNLEPRVAALETSQTQQNTRLTNLETSQNTLNTRMGAAEANINTHTTQIGSINTGQTQQNTRLTALETKNTTQDNRLTAVETKNTTQDGSISALQTANTTNANAIANIRTDIADLQEEVSQMSGGGVESTPAWISHRNNYRGKNLGTTVTAAQWTAIQNGSFDDLYVGDYWVMNATNWRIADINNSLGVNGLTSYPNFLVIVPDFLNGVNTGCTFRLASATAAFSYWQFTGLSGMLKNTVTPFIQQTGFAGHIRSFSASVSDATMWELLTMRSNYAGLPTANTRYVDHRMVENYGTLSSLSCHTLTEQMIFGTRFLEEYSPNIPQTGGGISIDLMRLKIFELNPAFINPGASYWLGDIVSKINVDSSSTLPQTAGFGFVQNGVGATGPSYEMTMVGATSRSMVARPFFFVA